MSEVYWEIGANYDSVSLDEAMVRINNRHKHKFVWKIIKTLKKVYLEAQREDGFPFFVLADINLALTILGLL